MGGDYPNALLTLNNQKSNLPDDIWHFNMGTVLGKLDQLPLARYHFMMAEAKGFHGEQLSEAQDYISEKLELERLEKPIEVQDYLFRTGMIFSEGIFTTFSLIFVVLGIWLIRKKAQISQIIMIFVLALIPLGLDFWVRSMPKRIVMDSTPVFEAPTAIFGTKGELPPGVMIITKQKEGWEYVLFPSRFSGWIKPVGIKPLEHK